VLVADGALVGSQQPAFQQCGDSVHARQRFAYFLKLPTEARDLVIIARNHMVRGARMSWKMVPAVTEVWCLQAEHWNKEQSATD
jgi:hypothetical protein